MLFRLKSKTDYPPLFRKNLFRRESAIQRHVKNNLSNNHMEIVTSERERILSEHVTEIKLEQAAFFGAAKQVGSGLLAGANHRRKLGILLASLKDATTSDGKRVVPHGDWIDLFSNGKNRSRAVFEFSDDTARRYVEFARKNPEPITALDQIVRDGKDMLIDAGEIEAREITDQTHRSHGESCKWLSLVSRAWAEIDTLRTKAPIDEWPEATRITLKEKLRPYVELYANL